MQRTGICGSAFSREILLLLGQDDSDQRVGAVFTSSAMPSAGDLTCESDRDVVKEIEETMRAQYVEVMCYYTRVASYYYTPLYTLHTPAIPYLKPM